MRVYKPGYRGVVWWITNQCFEGAELPSREQFDAAYDVGEIFIVSEGDKVKGYALMTLAYGCYTGPYIQSITVLPEHRGQGLGSQLITEVEDFCRNVNEVKIKLHCKRDSTVVQWYTKMGYEVVKVLKNYYAPEGDGIEMEYKL